MHVTRSAGSRNEPPRQTRNSRKRAEIDLAFVDYFDAVPDDVFEAYREILPIDTGFAQRRELWRLFGYLAVVTVDGHKPFGHRMLTCLADAVRSYL